MMLHKIDTKSKTFLVGVDDEKRLVYWYNRKYPQNGITVEKFDTEFDYDPPFMNDFFTVHILSEIFKILEPSINYRKQFGYPDDYDTDTIIRLS